MVKEQGKSATGQPRATSMATRSVQERRPVNRAPVIPAALTATAGRWRNRGQSTNCGTFKNAVRRKAVINVDQGSAAR